MTRRMRSPAIVDDSASPSERSRRASSRASAALDFAFDFPPPPPPPPPAAKSQSISLGSGTTTNASPRSASPALPARPAACFKSREDNSACRAGFWR
eukprot:27760-Pelagococcus_subviridis.AAC.8